jgi:hypothetical protein
MLKDIVAAKALGGYRLYLRFEDGVEGVVDLAPHLSFQGVFEPLRDPIYFAQVRVDPASGTVAWPNGPARASGYRPDDGPLSGGFAMLIGC